MKKLITLLVLITLSCNSDSKEKQVKEIASQKTEIPASTRLVVEIDFETNAPEDIKFISNDIFLNNGQSMDLYITQKVTPSELAKKVKFELPENVIPDFNIAIHLGKKHEKEVKINSISISAGSLTYQIDSKNLITYFRPNRFVNYDQESGTLKTKTIDGKHNPMIFLRKSFVEKIELKN